jgi:hypothetical protein
MLSGIQFENLQNNGLFYIRQTQLSLWSFFSETVINKDVALVYCSDTDLSCVCVENRDFSTDRLSAVFRLNYTL